MTRALASASAGESGSQISPPRTRGTTRSRSPSRSRTASVLTTSAVAIPSAPCRRTARLRPPTDRLPSLFLATGTPSRSTSL